VAEAPGQHRVHVGELERVVALDDALGGRPVLEGVDDPLEQHTRAGDAQAALFILKQGDSDGLEGDVHEWPSEVASSGAACAVRPGGRPSTGSDTGGSAPRTGPPGAPPGTGRPGDSPAAAAARPPAAPPASAARSAP